MRAARLRELLGANELKSTRFDVTWRGSGARFRGTGWGHGVGLCQEGMRAQAAGGRDYRAILASYFPGAALAPLWR